jgi:hypothetical protein
MVNDKRRPHLDPHSRHLLTPNSQLPTPIQHENHPLSSTLLKVSKGLSRYIKVNKGGGPPTKNLRIEPRNHRPTRCFDTCPWRLFALH